MGARHYCGHSVVLGYQAPREETTDRRREGGGEWERERSRTGGGKWAAIRRRRRLPLRERGRAKGEYRAPTFKTVNEVPPPYLKRRTFPMRNNYRRLIRVISDRMGQNFVSTLELFIIGAKP